MDIKLVLTDIDGVWTDGGMYYDEKGNELKRFNTADSYGVKALQLLDIPVGIITGELTDAVKRRAKKLGIEHLFMGVSNKLKVLEEICKKLNVSPDQTAYIGDDVIDIPVLEKVKISAVPAHSPDYVKKYAKWVMSLKGGEGVFREFVDRILAEYHLTEEAMERYLKMKLES